MGLGMAQKLSRSADDEYVLPHVRGAVQDAFARAGVEVDTIDGLETHDCFTPSEYLAIDHVGITGPGERAGRPSRTVTWRSTAGSRSTRAAG